MCRMRTSGRSFVITIAMMMGALALYASSRGTWAQSSMTHAVVLIDSTGSIAGRPLDDTVVLITDKSTGIVAPAAIRSVYDADGRTASGSATWQASGSVLFASSDCTSGAHVFSNAHAGLRATAQVQ